MAKKSQIKAGGKLNAALLRINGIKNTSMKVGILNGATNPDTGELIAPYAAANEFGTRNMPARPFFRNTIAKKDNEWGAKFEALAARNPLSKETVLEALNGLGGVMVADIQEEIETGTFAPLAPSTVARKKKKGIADPEKPLVETGAMQRAIDYEIMGDDS